MNLSHFYTTLGLGLPREPLKVAFRGLRTEDPYLRGTALEYLDSILPPEIRAELWRYLTTASVPEPSTRSSEEIVDELMRSSTAIDSKLESKGPED